jgi:putative serine protease PepD
VNAITSLTPAVFADSNKINVGDNVVAIGSPLGLDTTVTAGIVSALNRTIQVANSAAPENGTGSGGGLQLFNGGSSSTAVPINLSVIQTDAAINPGNSGGALLNDQGQVLGINVAIASAGNTSGNGQAGSIGVGFAIPANNAQRIAAELIKSGKASHAMLGAYITDALSSNTNSSFSVGAKISKLMPKSPAGKAGIQVGDVIIKIDNEVINSASDLTALVRQLPAGAKANFVLQRAGKVLTIAVTLGDAVNLGK